MSFHALVGTKPSGLRPSCVAIRTLMGAILLAGCTPRSATAAGCKRKDNLDLCKLGRIGESPVCEGRR